MFHSCRVKAGPAGHAFPVSRQNQPDVRAQRDNRAAAKNEAAFGFLTATLSDVGHLESWGVRNVRYWIENTVSCPCRPALNESAFGISRPNYPAGPLAPQVRLRRS
jgi:hypothetical protein